MAIAPSPTDRFQNAVPELGVPEVARSMGHRDLRDNRGAAMLRRLPRPAPAR